MQRRDGDHDYGRIPLGTDFRTNLVFVTPHLGERELHWGERLSISGIWLGDGLVLRR